MFLISGFNIFVCLDDDEGNLKQTATHRPSEASRDNTSFSPHSPISSSQDLLSIKRRSHSFTSGSFAVINLNDLSKHDGCVNHQQLLYSSNVISICFCSVFCLSNLPEDQAHFANPQRSGKRLQLLCDSGGRGQVIRQHIHKQKLWASDTGHGWVAAGQLSGLCCEELYQPAPATQQVCLQEVFWEKRPLTFLKNDFTNKVLTNIF